MPAPPHMGRGSPAAWGKCSWWHLGNKHIFSLHFRREKLNVVEKAPYLFTISILVYIKGWQPRTAETITQIMPFSTSNGNFGDVLKLSFFFSVAMKLERRNSTHTNLPVF